MNSEFPMTFIEPETSKVKKVIPISHRSFAQLSQPGREGSNSRPRKLSLYPMSEFEDSDESKQPQKYQRSPLKFFLRLALALTFGSLWIAIGMGELHTDSPSVVQTRAFLSAQIPALSDFFQSDSALHHDSFEANEEQMRPDPLIADQEVFNNNIPEVAESGAMTSQLVGDVVGGIRESVLPDDSLRSEANMVESASTDFSKVALRESSELSAMLELFLEQGRQMQKMELHLLDMVRKNANEEQYTAFLSHIKKQHQSALKEIERLK